MTDVLIFIAGAVTGIVTFVLFGVYVFEKTWIRR